MNPTNFDEGFGGVQFPLDTNDFDINTGLTPLDPARDELLALFAAAINAELGPVWTKLTNYLPVGSPLRGTLPVQTTLGLEPDDDDACLKIFKIRFPLLTLERSGEMTFEQHSLYRDKVIHHWMLNYIVGELSAPQRRQFGDITTAIPKIIRLVIKYQGHPAYQAGAVQFFPDKQHIGRIDLISAEAGQATFAKKENSPPVWACTMKLRTEEYSYDILDGYSVVDSFSFRGGFDSANPDNVNDVVITGDSEPGVQPP